jgi:hypothetical protein
MMANDLYIKYHAQDAGARPIPTCGQNPPWPWLATSITMTDPAGNLISKAKVDEACKICVQVDSKESTYPAGPRPRVQVWVCDFTLGVGPGSVRQYNGSIPEAGLTSSVISMTPGAADSVASGAPGRAKIDWTPADGDLRNVNADGEAHMCIAANVYYEGPDAPGAEGAPMPPPDYVDICGNQHHAQLNIAIQPATVITTAVPLQVWGPKGGDFEVEIRPAKAFQGRVLGLQDLERIAVLPGVELRRPDRRLRFPTDEDGFPLEPTQRTILRAGGTLTFEGEPIKNSRRNLALIELRDAKGKQHGTRLKLPGGQIKRPQQIHVNAAFDRRERVGAVRAYDVVQRRGKALIGGARVVFVKTR